MNIREVNPGDAPEIAALWNDMIRETFSTFTTVEKSTADIEGLITARTGAFFVAEQAGVFAGFATFGPFRAGPGYDRTVEHTVLVKPNFHGAGMGRQLMQAIETAARTSGCHVIVAGISHTNLNAQVFHQHLGYKQVARMPQVGFKAGQWLDLILMQKIL